MRRLTLSLMVCAILVPAVIGAQRPRFEVATVRLVNTSDMTFLARITEERVELVHALRSVLLSAYEVRNHQLVLPDWADQLTVDIRAIIPPGVTRQEVPEMLRALLVERFGLVTHRETRQMDAYHLLVGPSGPRMRSAQPLDEMDEKFEDAVLANGQPGTGSERQMPGGDSRVISVPGGLRRITPTTRYDLTFDKVSNTQTVDAVRMTMAQLVQVLTTTLGEPVIDGTNLGGVYQFRLTLPPEAFRTNRLFQTAGGAQAPASEPYSGSPFKAVETLGLTLERRPGPVDIIVVDSMRREPTEN